MFCLKGCFVLTLCVLAAYFLVCASSERTRVELRYTVTPACSVVHCVLDMVASKRFELSSKAFLLKTPPLLSSAFLLSTPSLEATLSRLLYVREAHISVFTVLNVYTQTQVWAEEFRQHKI